MPNQPPAQTDQWLHITDFSAGCINYSETSGQGAHRFDPAPPGAADPAETYSCIALPSGGLGALPEMTMTYEWNGISVGGQTAYVVGFLVHDELANGTTEAFVIVEFDDGFTHHWKWTPTSWRPTPTPRFSSDNTPTNPGIFGAPYPAMTRVNMTTIAAVTVTSGSPDLSVSAEDSPEPRSGVRSSSTRSPPAPRSSPSGTSSSPSSATTCSWTTPTCLPGSGVAVIAVSSNRTPR